MTNPVLRLLSISLVLILGLAATVAWSSDGDQATEAPCETRLQKILFLPIGQLKGRNQDFSPQRIREQNAITDSVAHDYHLLIADPESHPNCTPLRAKLVAQLDSFFARRFRLLLDRSDSDGFYSEYTAILSYWGTREQRKIIQDKFEKFEFQYVQIILANLQSELLGTHWDDWSRIVPHLERWSDEWTTLLGAHSNGGVLLDSRRIAIQPGDLDPISLKILLFHELSHLADPRLKTRIGRDHLTPADTEIYAWNETMNYLQKLEKEGEPIPDRFLRVRAQIRDPNIGIYCWVESIIDSRSPKSR
ncbi:hypothetical protein WDW37_03145 [Bdellovibrionota bacterium FG-1]